MFCLFAYDGFFLIFTSTFFRITNKIKKGMIMKRLFTRCLALLVCAFAVCLFVKADNDKVISLSQLPATAQQIIKKNFAGKNVALVKMESGLLNKSYEVIFSNGDNIEFDNKGNWTEISCKSSQVPASLIPSAIKNYVTQNYPDATVKSIEKDRGEYEVKLSNRLEITFNKKFQVVDIDD